MKLQAAAPLSRLANRASTGQWETALTWGLIGTGALLRLYRLSFLTLWSDEYWTIKTLHVPWPQLLAGQYPGDANPPLYFIVLRLWLSISGESEMAMRIFSLAFALAALALFVPLARQMLPDGRSRIAALAAVSFHPFFLHYSTEIRSYSFLLFFSTLAFVSYGEYIRSGRQLRWLFLMSLGLAASFYTHHFALLALLGLGCFNLIDWIWRRDRKPLGVTLGLAAAVAAYLPGVVWIVLPQFTAAVKFIPSISSSTREYLLGIFSVLATFPPHAIEVIETLSVIALLLGMALLVHRSDSRINGYKMILLVLVSVLAMLVISSRGIYLFARYWLPVSFFPFALIAATQAKTRGIIFGAARWAGAAVILLYILNGVGLTASRRNLFPDWRQVAAAASELALPQEPVVVMGWDSMPVERYLDHGVLSSFSFEVELTGDPRSSYLIIDSKYGQKPALLDTAQVLYEDREQEVRILRLVPAAKP